MRINFIIEGAGLAKGNGICSAATRLASFLRKDGIKVDINGSGYNYDIVHSHTPMFFTLAKFMEARNRGIKIVAHAHTTAEDVKGSWSFTESKYFLDTIAKYLTFFYNNADLILAPSGWTAEMLKKRHVKPPIKVISNGVDRKIFKFSEARRKRFRDQYGFGKNDKVVYCVGIVYLRKGIETFIKVAERFPEVKFIWIGHKYPSALIGHSKITKILETAPPNVKMLGFVDNIVDAHCGSDILLFPSYAENQGIAVLEAMSCGRPAIVRNLPSYRSWGLTNGENSLISFSEQDFSKNLSAVLEDTRLREKLSENGKKYVKNHDIRKVCGNLIKIYEDLVDSKSGS